MQSWKQHIQEIELWQQAVDKPIIFTEIGYSSYNGTTMHPEKPVRDETLDLQEQTMAYEAAMTSLHGKPWLRGLFWHFWDPRPEQGGLTDPGRVPQNKPAERIVDHWYHQTWSDSSARGSLDFPDLAVSGLICSGLDRLPDVRHYDSE